MVVDDEESIVEFLSFALEREGFQTCLARNGQDALRVYHEGQPDMVILDLMLPDLSGLEVCQSLRCSGNVPILMLTARDELQDKVDGLESGADDYLVKPFKFKELLARVRALLRRTTPSGPQLSYGDLRLDSLSHTASHQGRVLALTLKEYRLLEQMMRRPATVFSREQLLKDIWGWDSTTETNVVEVHVSALRAKIGEAGKKLIRTVRGVGYSIRVPSGDA